MTDSLCCLSTFDHTAAQTSVFAVKCKMLSGTLYMIGCTAALVQSTRSHNTHCCTHCNMRPLRGRCRMANGLMWRLLGSSRHVDLWRTCKGCTGMPTAFPSLLLSFRADGIISTLLCKLHCLITTLMHVLRCHQTTHTEGKTATSTKH